MKLTIDDGTAYLFYYMKFVWCMEGRVWIYCRRL